MKRRRRLDSDQKGPADEFGPRGHPDYEPLHPRAARQRRPRELGTEVGVVPWTPGRAGPLPRRQGLGTRLQSSRPQRLGLGQREAEGRQNVLDRRPLRAIGRWLSWSPRNIPVGKVPAPEIDFRFRGRSEAAEEPLPTLGVLPKPEAATIILRARDRASWTFILEASSLFIRNIPTARGAKEQRGGGEPRRSIAFCGEKRRSEQ